MYRIYWMNGKERVYRRKGGFGTKDPNHPDIEVYKTMKGVNAFYNRCLDKFKFRHEKI